jgi:hypothetical protein
MNREQSNQLKNLVEPGKCLESFLQQIQIKNYSKEVLHSYAIEFIKYSKTFTSETDKIYVQFDDKDYNILNLYTHFYLADDYIDTINFLLKSVRPCHLDILEAIHQKKDELLKIFLIHNNLLAYCVQYALQTMIEEKNLEYFEMVYKSPKKSLSINVVGLLKKIDEKLESDLRQQFKNVLEIRY